MSSYPATDPQLIAAIADRGQQDAWYQFERLYAPALLSTLRKQGFSASDADDCCQRIFAKLILAAGKFKDDGQPAAFRRWLYRVARNETITFLRQQTRHPISLSESQWLSQCEQNHSGSLSLNTTGNPDIESSIEYEYRKQVFLETAAIVQAEINPLHWQAFYRTMIDGEPTPVVAKDLNMSVGAVYVAKGRVLKKLQQAAKDWEDQS